jgi:hypothetical protein
MVVESRLTPVLIGSECEPAMLQSMTHGSLQSRSISAHAAQSSVTMIQLATVPLEVGVPVSLAQEHAGQSGCNVSP